MQFEGFAKKFEGDAGRRLRTVDTEFQPAERATAFAVSWAIGRSAGYGLLNLPFLGFRFASPQALCCRPLRGLLGAGYPRERGRK